MAHIKQVIEIALNDGYTVPRFEVHRVELLDDVFTVYYLDKLLNDVQSCNFAF